MNERFLHKSSKAIDSFELSGSSQAVSYLSGSRHTVVRQLSGSRQAVVRQSSGSRQAVMKV